MNRRSKWPICAIGLLLVAVGAFGQAWSGILTPARAADWTLAGIPGGIPSGAWANCVTTACNTAFSNPTPANVAAACTGAPNNTVVRIPAGALTWSANMVCNRGNVAIRGAGPSATTITMGAGHNILLGGPGSGGQGSDPTGLASTNWSGGLTQGNTVLTVASTTGLSAGQFVILDQHNAPWVFTFAVEGECTAGNSCGRNDATNPPNTNPSLQFFGADNRAQQEMVQIHSVDSSTQITIEAPGISHDYNSGQCTYNDSGGTQHNTTCNPQVFWWSTPKNAQFAGIENLTINNVNGNDRLLSLPHCDMCWVKNVAVTNHTTRGAFFFFWSAHDEVRDSYVGGDTSPGHPQQYGVELLETSYAKVENNIFYDLTSPIMFEGSYAPVIGYNYMVNNIADNAFGAMTSHLAHAHKALREGNVLGLNQYDNSWGSESHGTSFRNRTSGHDPNKTNYREAMELLAHNRYINLVGNVIGDPTFHTIYQCTLAQNNGGSDVFEYDLGWFDGCVNNSSVAFDATVETSLMRWGNWDAVTYCANGGHSGTACGATGSNGVRNCTAAATGNPACTTSETASTDPTFPGLPSPSTTLPASFYTGATAQASCGTGLSFWKNPTTGVCPPYPPIGPDVTGGNVTNTAGHASKIPAQLCYENTAKNGSGFLTAFDAGSCYANDPSGAQPTVTVLPASLTFAPQLINTPSATQTVTIQNTLGGSVLTMASLQVPAQYFQSGGTCTIPGSLSPGVSCTVLIGFQPTQSGTVTGSLCFNDNAVGSPQCVPMSGVGTPTTASFTPNPLAFGPHTVGSTSAPLMATLTNTGAAVLTLNCSGCGIGITNSSIFSFVGTTCGAQLGPGAFCTVSISFSPPSSGAFSGTMTYTTDAANSPNVITMTGSGGTSHWVIGRVGIGAMRWGRNAGLPTPNLYFARTDQCNGSGTGGDTGCTGQAAMNFFGRNTSAGQAYTPIDVPPLLNTGNPLTGQNVCGIDTDFHTKICRVTDYSSMSALGSGFNTGSGGDVQNWAADTSGYIVYTAGGGQPILMSFTPGTMASSASQIGGIVGTSDCSGAVYFGTNCKSFVTGNISYSPSDGSAIYEMDLGPAPTHIYLNKLTLSKAGAPSTWSFSRSMLFDFGSAGGSTHCLPSDFAASYVGSFNISADSSTFAFAIGDNGQNGQRDYTITGVIASGSFTKGETLTQAVTGAVTVVDTCGALACTSPFAIRAYTGTPDSTHDWVGTGGGHFTPTGLPVLQHYGASFLVLYDTGQTGCRVLKTFGPGHDGFGPMVIDGDWGPTGNVLMGTDKQATTCNATNAGQTPNCYPNTVPLGTSAGPTLLDTMELHNAGPTNDKKYVVFSGSDIQACTTVGGRSTCYCASSNLCEAYTWEGATLNIRPNLPEGHNVKGSLGAYKGTNYAFFTYHDPYIKLSNLLTVTIPVDQHGASGNLNSVDAEPVAFAAQQSCGTATGPGNLACDPNYGTITGTPGNYPYYDEFVAVENQGAYCSVNPTIGPICLTPPAQHCNYGAGANTTACAYRFAHCFNSGTNWNFSTQNCIANISPNGDYAMLATDWFPTGSATDGLNRGFGCTNGDDGITPGHLCLPNLDANGKGTAYTTSASKSGSTITFISTDTTVGIMKPTVGAKLTVSGFAVETRYNATWTVATSPGGGVWTASSTATAFAADSGGKANWDCGNGALASTPCPRGDIVVINLRTAGTVH